MIFEYTIDYTTWFSERKLLFKPNHFIRSTTQLTHESELWILKNLKGRYALVIEINENFETYTVPAFEDPQEVTLYELTWG